MSLRSVSRSSCSGGEGSERTQFREAADKRRSNGSIESCEAPPAAQTWSEIFRAWPTCTILIVANEFFEKFASLGAVLPLYLLNVLQFSPDQTTIFFSLYLVCGGITPLFGSILADGYVGRFRTILYATSLYGMGKIVMAFASFFPKQQHLVHPWVDAVGIVLIIFAMGGIVPCVASFSGDQFPYYQTRMISLFFSIFYASINAGSFFSSIFLPIIRAQPCFGEDMCYSLSFAVSAFFMILASVLFFAGSRLYRKLPPKGDVFRDVFDTCKTALRNRHLSKVGGGGEDTRRGTQISREPQHHEERRVHWLDYYFITHNCADFAKCQKLREVTNRADVCERRCFIDDMKAFLRILVMYLPIPMFWALYGQQYSVWVLQSLTMDCRIYDDILLLPDQLLLINPLMIVVFIALFEVVVYPFCSRFVELRPLRRMVTGGVCAALSFVVAGFLQIELNKTLPLLPNSTHSYVSVMNTFDGCDLNVTLLDRFGGEVNGGSVVVPRNTSLVNNLLLNRRELFYVLADGGRQVSWKVSTWNVDDETSCRADRLSARLSFALEPQRIYYIYVGEMGAFLSEAEPKKSTQGLGEFGLSLATAFTDENYDGNLTLCRIKTNGLYGCDPSSPSDFFLFGQSSPVRYTSLSGRSDPFHATIYGFTPIRPGNWRVFYARSNRSSAPTSRTFHDTGVEVNMARRQGGVYVLLLSGTTNTPQKRVFQVSPDSTISILWQIPQKAIITAAEILFSVTGYEFSYLQSGKSMKSVVQALWFLTASVGNTIIIFATLLRVENMATQCFIFAGAMIVFIIIFALLAIFYYEYRDNSADNYYLEQ